MNTRDLIVNLLRTSGHGILAQQVAHETARTPALENQVITFPRSAIETNVPPGSLVNVIADHGKTELVFKWSKPFKEESGQASPYLQTK
jgi:hypothetical protein